MKRLSILVLVILVLVAALAACAPTTPPVEPHEHSYATEWSSNETHHWYANTCNHGNDVVSAKAEHVDAAEDGKCDVCDYVLFYTFTVTAPDFVTVSDDLKGKGDVTFTASAPAYYTLSVEGAEQVGEAAVEGGIATYTFKVANLASNDVEVVISGVQTSFANLVADYDVSFIPEGDASILGAGIHSVELVINLPAAGTYTLVVSGTEEYVFFGYEGENAVLSGNTFVANEAGEYTLTVSADLWWESDPFDVVVSVFDVYATEIELPATSGEGYVIPANKTNEIVLKVTIPTAGIYVMNANGLLLGLDSAANYVFETTSDNEVVEIVVNVDPYFEENVAELSWDIVPAVFNALADGANELNIVARGVYLMSFTAPAAGKYMIVCDIAGASFATWGEYGLGYPYYYANEAISLAEGETIEFAYISYEYDPVTINISVEEFVATVPELPMGDLELTKGLETEYEFTATEAGKLVIVTGEFMYGSVDVKYYLNGEFGAWINGNSTYEISVDAGDVVLVNIDCGGVGSMNISWVAGGSEGGDEGDDEPGSSETNPIIFTGSDMLGIWADPWAPTYITIPGGVTVYINGEASFFTLDNDYVGNSASPAVDTTYILSANSPMQGCYADLSTTDPEGGDDVGGGETPEGQLPLGENINFEPDDVNVTYTYTADAYGKLTLTPGKSIMGTVTITYSVNGGDIITLEENVSVEIELYAYDMITVVVTNNGAYQSLTTAWEYLELEEPSYPDGSQDNPFIFDGSMDLDGWTEMGRPSYFVMVKGGTTAYILGNAAFNDGFENLTVVSPEADTLYAVVITTANLNGEDFLITATKPVEGGDGTRFNPYVFDGTSDVAYSLVDDWGVIFVLVKGGTTANLTGDAYFTNFTTWDMCGTSVSPTEDTLYTVNTNNTAGANGVVTAEAQGGDDPAPNPGASAEALPLGNKEIAKKDVVYSFTAATAGTLKVKQAIVMMGDYAIVTVSVNGGESVTIVPQSDYVDFALEAGDVVIISISANAYSTLQTEWVEGAAAVEPDGSQENPFVFDGTTVLSGDATFGMPSYFVMIKAGVTAYVHGNAKFGNDYGELFASVSPTEDTIYAVVADTFEGASFSISTEAPVVEEPKPEVTGDPLPLGNKEIAKKDAVYSFTAATAGTLKVKQAIVMMGDYAIVTVSVNGGESVTIVPQSDYVDFALEAGDVVIISISANAYSTLQTEWVEA